MHELGYTKLFCLYLMSPRQAGNGRTDGKKGAEINGKCYGVFLLLVLAVKLE